MGRRPLAPQQPAPRPARQRSSPCLPLFPRAQYGKTISMLLRTTFSGDSQLVRARGARDRLPAAHSRPRRWLRCAGLAAVHRTPIPCPLSYTPQGSWYTWVSLMLFVLFAGFWMSRYSKAMKLFPVLIIMPIIQAGLGGG